MAFRPTANIIEGVLDNTTPGVVRGWIDFYREGTQPLHCVIELDGDFHDDIRGRVLHFWNENPSDAGYDGSLGRIEPEYIEHLHPIQQGKAGDITTNHHRTVCIEWYSQRNGRVVLNIDRSQAEVHGNEVDLSRLPPRKSHPDAFAGYLRELAIALRKHTKDPNATVLGIGDSGIHATDEPDRN